MKTNYVVKAQELSKSFNRQIVIDRLSFELHAPEAIAILGANGSGKSTLLSLIAGKVPPTSGSIAHQLGNQPLEPEDYYRYLSWMSSAIELYPYLNLKEACALHFSFKRCLLPSWKDCLVALELERYGEKALRQLSSGMLQRFKVGLALFSDTMILLLDEPTSFMDAQNSKLVLNLIDQYTKNRLYILASNIPQEYERISKSLVLTNNR